MMEIRPGGRGTPADVDLVRAELSKLPAAELEMLRGEGIGVVVCWDNVTDHLPELADDVPRNWSKETKWTIVPGCYDPDGRNVVIATIPDGKGARRIPPKNVMHGSWNLVLHETMHGDDYAAGRRRCRNPSFVASRSADLARVPVPLSAYERRPDQAGFEETYAESAARFFGNDPSFAADLPSLAAFWSGASLPLAPGPAVRGRRSRKDRPLGTATLLDDGDIELDVIAESDRGVIGHALFRVRPGDDAYANLKRAVGGTRSRTRSRPARSTVITSFAGDSRG